MSTKAEKIQQMKQENTQQLSPQQIQIAAQVGVSLIREGRVNVPSDVAMNGTLGILNAVLSSLATGSTILMNPEVVSELQEKAKPARNKVVKKTSSKR